MKKREKTLVGAAGGLVVVFLINLLVCGDPEDAGEAGAVSQIEQAASDISAQVLSVAQGVTGAGAKRPDSAPVVKSWSRDPFAQSYRLAPVDTSQAGLAEYALRGIVWRGDRAHVLIGNDILTQGDVSGNLKVLEIQKEQVICRIGHEIITLTLRDNEE